MVEEAPLFPVTSPRIGSNVPGLFAYPSVSMPSALLRGSSAGSIPIRSSRRDLAWPAAVWVLCCSPSETVRGVGCAPVRIGETDAVEA